MYQGYCVSSKRYQVACNKYFQRMYHVSRILCIKQEVSVACNKLEVKPYSGDKGIESLPQTQML